jgi:hypothetical protein
MTFILNKINSLLFAKCELAIKFKKKNYFHSTDAAVFLTAKNYNFSPKKENISNQNALHIIFYALTAS